MDVREASIASRLGVAYYGGGANAQVVPILTPQRIVVPAHAPSFTIYAQLNRVIMPLQRPVEATLLTARALTFTCIRGKLRDFLQEERIQVHVLNMRTRDTLTVGVAQVSSAITLP
jgi:hypothetical protein